MSRVKNLLFHEDCWIFILFSSSMSFLILSYPVHDGYMDVMIDYASSARFQSFDL